MKTLSKSFAIFMLVINFASFIYGQNSSTKLIKYGDTVNDILVSKDTENEYKFAASAGDVIVIDVKTSDILNALQPQIKLLNARGSTMASTSDIDNGLTNFDAFTSILAYEIPADGDYTILISDGPFQSATPNSKFIMRLFKPEILSADKILEDTSRKNTNSYYVIISKGQFALRYQKLEGEYYPAINIDRVENGILERLSTTFGDSLEESIVRVKPNRNTIHLVTITRAPFDTDFFGDSIVNYRLSVILATE